MVRGVLLAVGLSFAYLITFAAGSFLQPFGVTRVLASRELAGRFFVWDGVLLMVGLFLLTLLVEALGRHLRTLAVWTTASLATAALLGYLLRLGFVTRDF